MFPPYTIRNHHANVHCALCFHAPSANALRFPRKCATFRNTRSRKNVVPHLTCSHPCKDRSQRTTGNLPATHPGNWPPAIPTSSNTCPTIVQIVPPSAEIPVEVGHLFTDLGRVRSNFDQLRHDMADVDQLWRNSAHAGSNVGRNGKMSAKHQPKLAKLRSTKPSSVDSAKV